MNSGRPGPPLAPWRPPGLFAGGFGTLLERSEELVLIESALTETRSTQGTLVVAEGPAGIGKTALLDAARGATKGVMRVLHARGTELERDAAPAQRARFQPKALGAGRLPRVRPGGGKGLGIDAGRRCPRGRETNKRGSIDMFIHPSIHLEITCQRQQDLLARSELHRTAKVARTRRHEDRGRRLMEHAAMPEPSPTTTACRPHQANA